MKKICTVCRRTYQQRRRGVYRCDECQAAWESERNATRPQYGPEWERLARAAIAAEPWCHWPGGCAHADAGTAANPFTGDHIVPVAERPDLALEPSNVTVLCRRHNSGKRDRHLPLLG